MANLIAKKQQSTFPEFADRKLLADTGTRFCLSSAKLHTQKDGKTRWYLGIHFQDIAGQDETLYQTLTFDQSPSRDDIFMTIQEADDFPQHNCWVEKSMFKNKGTGMMQTFYHFRQDDEGTCPCGVTIEAEEKPIPNDNPLKPEGY